MAVELHNLLEDLAVVSFVEGNTMKRKTPAVQSLLEMTENRAKEGNIAGHPPPRMSRIGLQLIARFGIVLNKFRLQNRGFYEQAPKCLCAGPLGVDTRRYRTCSDQC